MNRLAATLITTAAAAVILTAAASACAEANVRRYLLSAGANSGGRDRVMLRYAVADANAFAAVFIEMGGVEKNNALVMANPSSRELLGGVANLGKLIAGDRAAEAGVRSEVFVYYSGHADDSGLKLGGETLPWSDFRNAVNGLDADVRVAVLDACGSGAITRTKGGVARPAFLSDASSNMKGYAFLTSSNESEASQESDRLRGSYFTHALLSGMRGAADMTGDGKVTINEAYQYAFSETLQNTQNTKAGTQHPSRDMNLAGTGDIVMTDLRETSAALSLDPNIEGRFFIRDASGNLFAELRKTRGRAIELGMPPGVYSVQMEAPSRVWMANDVEIVDGKKTVLTMRDMKAMERKREAVLTRGGSGGGEGGYGGVDGTDTGGAADDSPARPAPSAARAVAPPSPSLDSACRAPYRRNIALLMANSGVPERGVQLSLIVNSAGAEFCGTQAAAVANVAARDMRGAQVSGAVNISAGRLAGVQAGPVNLSRGDIDGLQAGAVNLSGGYVGYLQAGAVNVARGAGWGQAGAVNVGGTVGYVQAGAVNVGGTVGLAGAGAASGLRRGYQVGAVNVAGRVGRQVGVVNVAGYSERTPIGLINVIGNGIVDATLYGDLCGDVGVSLQTGTPWLYTAFEYQQPAGGWDDWPKAWGWGIGTRFGMNAPFYLNMDALWSRVNYYVGEDSPLPPGELNSADNDAFRARASRDSVSFRCVDALAKLRFGASYRPLPFVAVTAGMTANALFPEIYGIKKYHDPAFNTGTIWSDWTVEFGRGEYKVRVWPSFYAGLTLTLTLTFMKDTKNQIQNQNQNL